MTHNLHGQTLFQVQDLVAFCIGAGNCTESDKDLCLKNGRA